RGTRIQENLGLLIDYRARAAAFFFNAPFFVADFVDDAFAGLDPAPSALGYPIAIEAKEEVFDSFKACAAAAFGCLSDANGVLVSEKPASGESVNGAPQKITQHDQELTEDNFRTSLALLGDNRGDFTGYSVKAFRLHVETDFIKNVGMLGD